MPNEVHNPQHTLHALSCIVIDEKERANLVIRHTIFLYRRPVEGFSEVGRPLAYVMTNMHVRSVLAKF